MNVRWMTATVLGVLAFATWALWPGATFQLERARQPLVVTPAADVQAEAKREALDVAAQIMALRQVHRWSTRAVEEHAAGRALHMASTEPPARGFDSANPERVDQRARRMLRAWGLDAPRVGVGAYLPADDGYGWPDQIGRPGGFGGLRAVIDGRTPDGQPYCVQLGRLWAPPTSTSSLDWSPLNADGTGPGSFGACWLHARYGEPGPAIADWMRRVGAAAALVGKAPSERPWDFVDDPANRRAFRALGARPTSVLFSTLHAALADGCIGGDLEACRAVFVSSPTDSWRGRSSQGRRLENVVPNAFRPSAVSVRYLPEHWLHSLEAEYGPERMAAFWTSDQDVVTAFETAFGVDLETTMMELGRERFGYQPTGPRMAGWGWLGLLGSLALGLGASAHVMRRRAIA